MKKVNWEMIGAVGTIVFGVLAIVFAVFDPRSVWRPVLGGAIALFVLLILVTMRHNLTRALRRKPQLEMSFRDIHCHVTTKTIVRDDRVTGRKQWQETILLPEIAFRVWNKGKVKATECAVILSVILGEGNDAIRFEADPRTVGRRFSLTHGEKLPLIVRFPAFKLPEKEVVLYPNGPYRIQYAYTCTERSRSKTMLVKGKLTKADWTGEDGALQVVRQMGFRK